MFAYWSMQAGEEFLNRIFHKSDTTKFVSSCTNTLSAYYLKLLTHFLYAVLILLIQEAVMTIATTQSALTLENSPFSRGGLGCRETRKNPGGPGLYGVWPVRQFLQRSGEDEDLECVLFLKNQHFQLLMKD